MANEMKGGLLLIQDEERFVYEGDGYKIFYRRVPSTVRDSYIKKHTPRRGGEPDWTAIGKLMLRYAITGWSGLYEEGLSGERIDIPFDAEKIKGIPGAIQAEIIERLSEDAAMLERDIKNSNASSGSSGIMEE